MTPRAAPAESRSPVQAMTAPTTHDLVFGRPPRLEYVYRATVRARKSWKYGSPFGGRVRASVPPGPGQLGVRVVADGVRQQVAAQHAGADGLGDVLGAKTLRNRRLGDGLRDLLEEPGGRGRYVFAPAPLTWLSA